MSKSSFIYVGLYTTIQLYIHLFTHMCTSMDLWPCLLLLTILVTLFMFSNMNLNIIPYIFILICYVHSNLKLCYFDKKCFKTIYLSKVVLICHKILNLLKDPRWLFYRILSLCACFDKYYFSVTFHWHNWDEVTWVSQLRFDIMSQIQEKKNLHFYGVWYKRHHNILISLILK